MSDKRYYWLKLKDDFFEQDEIKLVEMMDNGKDYIIFYMKLVLKSINTEGELRFRETIPYNEKMLATITNTNVDVVKGALNIFIELGMMEKWDDGTLFMIETRNMIGSESASAARVRRHRERQPKIENKPKALQCNSNVTSGNGEVTNCNTEIDTEKEKEKEIERDIEKDTEQEQKSKYSPEFERWWNLYLRKQGKGQAYKIWKRDKLDKCIDKLIEKLEEQNKYQFSHTDIQYIPYPSTYLNGSRYDDEIENPTPPNPPKGSSRNGSVVQNAMERYK